MGASIMPEDIDWSGIIARFDFYVTIEDTMKKGYVADTNAAERLKNRLESIVKCNGPTLKPLYCTPDGNCLTYAVSRALVGSEILYSALRQQIVLELTNNPKYYLNFCGGLVDLLKDHIASAQRNEEAGNRSCVVKSPTA